MYNCLHWYFKVIGILTSFVGFSLLFLTQGNWSARYVAISGLVLIILAYIIKILIPVRRVYDWWLVFPELKSDSVATKIEKRFNILSFFYYFSFFVALLSLSLFVFLNVSILLWISGIFACFSFLLKCVDLWIFKPKRSDDWDWNWSLVYPELAGMYKDERQLEEQIEAISEEKFIDSTSLKLLYEDLRELEKIFNQFRSNTYKKR